MFKTLFKKVNAESTPEIHWEQQQCGKILAGIGRAFEQNSSGDWLSTVLYNKDLLEVCMIDGKYCAFNGTFTNEQILDVILKCKEYLDGTRVVYSYSHSELGDIAQDTKYGEFVRPLTGRQVHCGSYAISLLGKGEYNHALHEFMDCIDDYCCAKEKNKIISINEYGLYMCIIEAFVCHLKLES